MLLDDICDLLSSGGSTSDGTALFAGLMGEEPDAAICVYETGGMAPYRAMRGSPGGAVAERPRFQIVARGSEMDYATPRLKLNTIFQQLDGLGDRSINGVRYLWIGAVQSPFPLGKDGNGRALVGVNFEVVKEMSTS